MNYTDTKRISFATKLIGWPILVLCLLILIISFLKGLYFHFDNDPLFEGISRIVKVFIEDIYQNTSALNGIWSFAPTPNMMNPFDNANIIFVGIYIILFIAASMIRYGKSLSARLRKINNQIQDEILKGQLRGIVKSERALKNVITIESNSLHSLYFAPIIVGILTPFILSAIQQIFSS